MRKSESPSSPALPPEVQARLKQQAIAIGMAIARQCHRDDPGYGRFTAAQARPILDILIAALAAARQQQRAELLPIVEGEDLKMMVNGKPLWLASLPANLLEVQRGLEQGLFGPSWEGGQKWANAAMCVRAVEDAKRAVEVLIVALDAAVPGAREVNDGE